MKPIPLPQQEPYDPRKHGQAQADEAPPEEIAE